LKIYYKIPWLSREKAVTTDTEVYCCLGVI